MLEVRSQNLLNKRQKHDFQRLLGECTARMFDNSDDSLPYKVIGEAREELRKRSTERVKVWYISTTAIIVLFFCL